MTTLPWLSLTVFLPLLGATLLIALRRLPRRAVHTVGTLFATLSLGCAVATWATLPGGAGFALVEEVSWIPSLGAAYRVGVDGVSLSLVLLTCVLFLVALVYSWNVSERPVAYVALFLFLETCCLGVFLALDLVLFYVFFELTLVGMYFIINGWGHEGRQRAALMFFLYTLFGSLPLLLAILALYFGSSPHTFDMRAIVAAPPLTGAAAGWTFGAMLLTFAVKTPLFPVHTWLPEAHVEAPAPGSVILAGVLLKLGTYGLIRFALQMVPGAFRAAAPAVAGLAILSALYGALVALAQTDLKRMVAYTSVNHMGYVVLAIAAASAATRPGDVTLALDGATLQMVSHGVVTGALFLLVGALQARAHTREMSAFGGLLSRVPGLGWAFVFAAFASLGLPGLAHFPAEFQIFLGVFGVWPWATAAVILGLLVTAGLYLRAIRIAFLGGAPEAAPAMPDLHRREWAAILPLLALALVIGLGPQLVVGLIHGAVEVVRR